MGNPALSDDCSTGTKTAAKTAAKTVATAHLAPHQFKPGQSGNAAGRPRYSLSRKEVHLLMSKLAASSMQDVLDIIKDPKSTMLQLMLARTVLKAAEGDLTNTMVFLDRTIGRVKEELKIVEHSADFDKKIKAMRRVMADPESAGAAKLLAARLSAQRLEDRGVVPAGPETYAGEVLDVEPTEVPAGDQRSNTPGA